MNTSVNKQRDSNMELYRILAMLTVLFFHASGEIDLLDNQLFPDQLTTTSIINLWLDQPLSSV